MNKQRKSKKPVTASFRAKGHLIDSGLMSDALEAVQAAGATYRVIRLDIGKNRLDESDLELEVTAPTAEIFDRVRADLMSLGLSETDTQDAVAAMEKSTVGVVEGTKLSDAAGQALAEIQRVSGELAELIGRISAQTQRQSASVTDVTRGMVRK